MNVCDDLRQQAQAVHTARSLLRHNARKIGLRASELARMDLHLARAADSLAIVAGSRHADEILADSARPA